MTERVPRALEFPLHSDIPDKQVRLENHRAKGQQSSPTGNPVQPAIQPAIQSNNPLPRQCLLGGAMTAPERPMHDRASPGRTGRPAAAASTATAAAAAAAATAATYCTFPIIDTLATLAT